jgi:hypothetical protein
MFAHRMFLDLTDLHDVGCHNQCDGHCKVQITDSSSPAVESPNQQFCRFDSEQSCLLLGSFLDFLSTIYVYHFRPITVS